jgi:hypothetical protein
MNQITYESDEEATIVADGLAFGGADDIERYLSGARAPMTLDQLRLAEPWLFDPASRTPWLSRAREMCERAALKALIRRNPTIRLGNL